MMIEEAVLPARLAPVYAERMSDADDPRFLADLEAARQGDREAFWRLVEPLQGRLYGYLRKALNFSDEADDVFQETVLRAFRFLPAFRPGSFAVWIFSIAHNETRRWQGRRARQRHEPLEAAAVPAVTGDPSERALVDEVYAAAAELSPGLRRVFFLFYDSGFDLAEIGAITGASRASVKFALFRARRLLRARLGGLDEND